jgi:hypothetical protein
MKKNAILIALGSLVVGMVWAWRAGREFLADADEQTCSLPGDELIRQPVGSVTHAITIHRPPRDVWRWLAQMGSDRGGWYAYDFIDNGGNASTNRIRPELQDIGVGTVFPALPGVKDVFVVVRCEPPRDLVLAWKSPDGIYFTTWAFVLEEPEPGRTRLLVRGRAGSDYHPFGLPLWASRTLAPLAHGVMQRKQLLGIAQRAEQPN